MKLDRLQETILFLLDFAHKEGIKNLSRFQIMKIIYLLDIESRKYTGQTFFINTDVTYYRYARGPISTNIYDAIKALSGEFVDISLEDVPGYTKQRACHKLIKNIDGLLSFSQEERIFLSGIFSDYVSLPQSELKNVVYSTEPMTQIQSEEKISGNKLIGSPISMQTVSLDSDIADVLGAE